MLTILGGVKDWFAVYEGNTIFQIFQVNYLINLASIS